MKLTVTVCDVCEDPERATLRFEIRHDGLKTAVDLCEEHSAPLLSLMQTGAEKNTRSTTGRTRPPAARKPAKKVTQSRVTTLEDIEKLKKKK